MTDDNDQVAAEAWAHYDNSPQGRETYRAAAEAVYIDGVGSGPRGNEHLPSPLSTIREGRAVGGWVDGPYTGDNMTPAPAWFAPTEAERWQWMSDAERGAEVAEARAAADRNGHDFIWVGGMVLPHPAPFSDGMWDLPTVSINVNTEEFRARMAEARERIGDVGAAIAAVFERINNGLGPAFTSLGRALHRERVTYWTPDGPPPPPIVDAQTALAALGWAERTEVVYPPDKRTRRHAKARYLAVRRHLPREHRRRLKSVPVNQFGSLT